MYGPYGYQMPQRYEVIHVNGRGGADALQMLPNSTALVLDDTAPLVWLLQTDGAGYKTVTPYSITPYKPEPVPDMRTLEDRIRRLEEMLNGKSDTAGDTAGEIRKRSGRSADGTAGGEG